MKKTLLIFLILTTLSAFSQQYKPGKGGGLYSTGQDQIDKGWFFGIGGTYMLGYLNETNDYTFTDSLGNLYDQKYTADPKGKFGLYFELGKFKMNDRKFINYHDFALAYKWFRGGEDYTLENSINTVPQPNFTTKGSFGDHLISAHYNIGYRFDQNESLFYVNGLGLNLDYHIITGRSGTPPIPQKTYESGPSNILGEMHYFFGMGFKTGKRLIIMPIIETPILAIYPFNHIVSTHPYSNTRFRPIMFRVRFMFLKKGSKSCPAVFNPMGIDPNNNLQK
jgi:hypothetical protein